MFLKQVKFRCFYCSLIWFSFGNWLNVKPWAWRWNRLTWQHPWILFAVLLKKPCWIMWGQPLKSNLFFCIIHPARGGKCSDGGIVPNTAFILRVFVPTPRSLSYLCIFSSFYLALNLDIQEVNSHSYSITWNFRFKFLLLID